jgi:multidrug efflux pump subunit AcrB
VIQAAVSGAGQVAGAVTASTLTTVCVFLPIVFTEGLTRQLFTDLALTMTYSLMASLIVSLTLVPAMASGMLRKEKKTKDLVMGRLLGGYRHLVSWSLNHKLIVLLAATALLIVTAVMSLSRGFIFMPEMDMPNVSLSVTMPEGSTMEESAVLADEVLSRIDTVEGIATVGAMMSSDSASIGGVSQENHSLTVYITLEDETASGMAVSRQIEDLCADMACEVSGSSAMMDISALSGSGVGVQVFADDMDTLQEGARKVAEVLSEVEGIAEVSDGLEEAAPALHIAIDRNKAMEKGITVAQIYMELATALTETKNAVTLEVRDNSTDVIIERPDGTKLDVDALRDYAFTVTKQDGEKEEFLLSDVAKLEETSSLTTIQRIGQRRYLTVTGTVGEGYNVTLVSADVQKTLENADLGNGVTLAYSGENESIMEAVEQLLLMLLLGIILVYLVMVAQFQSLRSPFIVMFTIPLAFTGGFMALLICGMEVSVISLIGFVMLTGIIVNNGIVLVDYINQLRMDGAERRAAILEAGETRMRPILMTTITTILGLIDMAVRKSAGTALMRPIAVVCIGGLIYATLMTLFVVPCIYDLLNKKELRNVREEDLKLLDI